MANSTDKDVLTIEKFAGLRNVGDEVDFEVGELAVATNVDITDRFLVKRRTGFAAALFSGAHHSLFAHKGVWLGVTAAGTLKRLFTDGTASDLHAGLGDRVDFATLGDHRIYYSDGNLTGCVDGEDRRSWGLEPPASQPSAAASGGTLPTGVYQYAVTYVRGDGQESGTGTPGRIELATSGGIAFSEIPISSDPDIVVKHLYISPADDPRLYLAQILSPDDTTAMYQHRALGLAPLRTMGLTRPIGMRHLAVYNTRVFGADGAFLRYTEPLSPELMDLRKRFELPEEITVVAPVRDGIWVGTRERVAFLGGNDPAAFTYDEKLAAGAIPGTLAYADAAEVEEGASGTAAIFMTTAGIVQCLNGGIIKNVTRDRFAFPIQERGAGVVRSHGGMVQYLAVLEGTETPGNTAT